MKLLLLLIWLVASTTLFAQFPDPVKMGNTGLPPGNETENSNNTREQHDLDNDNRSRSDGQIENSMIENGDQVETTVESEQKRHFQRDSIKIIGFDEHGKPMKNTNDVYKEKPTVQPTDSALRKLQVQPNSDNNETKHE